jgi:hypothetical protein
MRETVINISETLSATIASGAALTGSLNLGGLRLVGIVMPATWTAAVVTFQVSPDGGVTWANMYDINGNEVTAQTATGRAIMLDPTLYAGVQYMQVRSGASAAPVNQAQNSTLQLILRSV